MYFRCPKCKRLLTSDWKILSGGYTGKQGPGYDFFVGRGQCNYCDTMFDIGVENGKYKKIIITPEYLVLERMSGGRNA